MASIGASPAAGKSSSAPVTTFVILTLDAGMNLGNDSREKPKLQRRAPLPATEPERRNSAGGISMCTDSGHAESMLSCDAREIP